MKFNKNTQYALLLSLYLCRAGRAKVSDIAAELALSPSLLASVANKMRREGVIRSFRGPGGGFELVNKDVSIAEASMVGDTPLIKPRDAKKYARSIEGRALIALTNYVTYCIAQSFTTELMTVSHEVQMKDNKHFETLTDESPVN